MTVFGDFFVFDSFLSDFCQFFVTFLHFDTFLSDICYIFDTFLKFPDLHSIGVPGNEMEKFVAWESDSTGFEIS